MATTTSNKRKKAVAATVAAAAILLAGTFAWTSISQQALNESAGVVNVGGRLHDDFDGENKDVYVENFTDPLDGGQPIYARIRLDEYMEVGPDAGGVDDGDGNETEFTPVVAGTDREDETTWITHIPNANTENGATCDTDPAGTHVIHEHWEWEMGGSTVFMPTFNKDKDSLESDINGTYHGTDRDADTHDKVYYDDYVTYTTATDGKIVEGAVGTTAIKEPVYQRKADATYDDDTDNEPGGQKRTENEIHTAKETASAKVILMKDWNGEAGNFWVYDEDGWAYWANPIMPGEATGLLLSGINMEKNPGEKCYYGINVVAQFATVGDWGYFNDEKTPDQFDGTKEALALLETASENVAKVTVTNKDSQTTVDLEAGNDNTVTFSAATFVGESEKTGTYDWAVYNANLEAVTTSTITDNGDGTVTLTVGSDEKNDALIIAAKSTTYPGAVGLASIGVTVAETPVMKITARLSSEETSDSQRYLEPGKSYILGLTKDGSEVADVTYEMTLVDTSKTNPYDDDGVLSSDTKLEGSILTVAADETGTYYDNYNIVEVVAKNAGGDMLASRRFLIDSAGFRSEGIVFVSAEGDSTDTNANIAAALDVGQPYTWYIPIQSAASNAYLNEWLTFSDVDLEVTELSAYTSTYETDWEEIPNDEYLTISPDLSTITVNKAVSEEDGLYVRARGLKTEEVDDDGNSYILYGFETKQPVVSTDVGN